MEWLQKQVKEITAAAAAGGDNDDSNNRDLTDDEADNLRERMVTESGFDPSTTDRDHIGYDPLRYWVLYIKHVRESYPSDSQRQFLIMLGLFLSWGEYASLEDGPFTLYVTRIILCIYLIN